ncbi:hypothetical protein QFC20_003770 [Naganishia adeliensis]|uniref:Uncharacterized protein n=1 Tax=Naganishia adeliensis TaxID=92952 RepID=A0ACC2W812_9TREE|nr:hypothetical protein QFC20_003770 [Naganishia adeliensis]
MPAEFADVLTNQPVVIDNGSGTIKAGFAGQEQPKCYFPNFVGRPKHQKVMMGGLEEADVYIGRKAQELRGLLKIKYPVEHGIVTDWDDMETIWKYVYHDELGTLPEEHPALLTEAPLNPRQNRDVAAQIFFETFNVPAMFMSVQAVLALDVTDYLQLLLRKSGHHLHTSAEREIVRTIKEKTCYVPANVLKEDKELMGKTEEFRLPDGKVIQLGSERYWAPEILFNPELIGSEDPGVPQSLMQPASKTIIDSLNRVDLDLRKGLYSNILLRFGDRVLSDVKRLAPQKDVKLKIYAPPERKYSTWIGGSILAGLSTFKKMWVSAEEYQEDPDIIHRRAM